MRNFCKIFVVLLSILTSFGNVLYADEELYTEGNLQYTINNDSRIEVAYYYGKETTFTIPWTIGVYQIVDFKDGSFTNSDVTTIRVPDYYTIILQLLQRLMFVLIIQAQSLFFMMHLEMTLLLLIQP